MDTFTAITSRQGVLRFKPTPVEPHMIERVLQAAIAAPSPANTQPWDFVVVTAPDLIVQVADYLVETQAEYVFRRLLHTPEAFVEHLMHLYDEFDDTPCFILVCRNQRVDLAPPDYAHVQREWDLCCLGAAMANLMAVATDIGLGTRWFGGLAMDDGGAPLKALLSIPEHVEIVAATPLGYHDEPPKERPEQSPEALTGFRRGEKYKLAALLSGKLPLDLVAHYNTYGQRNQT